MSKNKKIAKTLIVKTAGYSTAFTVGIVVAHNAPVKHTYQKVMVFIASSCIAAVVADAVEKSVAADFDEIVDAFETIVDKTA